PATAARWRSLTSWGPGRWRSLRCRRGCTGGRWTMRHGSRWRRYERRTRMSTRCGSCCSTMPHWRRSDPSSTGADPGTRSVLLGLAAAAPEHHHDDPDEQRDADVPGVLAELLQQVDRRLPD